MDLVTQTYTLIGNDDFNESFAISFDLVNEAYHQLRAK